jgi:hypothetical protein
MGRTEMAGLGKFFVAGEDMEPPARIELATCRLRNSGSGSMLLIRRDGSDLGGFGLTGSN